MLPEGYVRVTKTSTLLHQTNQPGLPAGADARRVLLNRLLYDRDTREREPWVRGGEGEGE